METSKSKSITAWRRSTYETSLCPQVECPNPSVPQKTKHVNVKRHIRHNCQITATEMAGKDKAWVEVFGHYNATRPNEIDVLPKINDTALDNFYENSTGFTYSNFTTDDYCSSNHSHVYLNVTCEFPIKYAEPMYGWVPPLSWHSFVVKSEITLMDGPLCGAKLSNILD